LQLSSGGVLALGLSGALLGVAIGCTGVGGVLLVPFLLYGLGLPVQQAIALALYSYLLSGVLAVVLYARRGSIPWRPARWLSLGALPGAYLGARAVPLVPGRLLQALIAVALVAAGLHAAFPRAVESRPQRVLGAPALSLLGGLTGFLSALLGGGGAFVLVPLLLVLGQPLLLAVGLGQVIQLPISAVASYANLRAGLVDVPLGTELAVCLALGIALGTPLAHSLPQRTLRRVLALSMLLAGLAMGVRLVVGGRRSGDAAAEASGAQFFVRRH
jgi:uncharacterized membrane protein YfcA